MLVTKITILIAKIRVITICTYMNKTKNVESNFYQYSYRKIS